MGTIPFVKKEHFDLARTMEQKMLSLPEDSGILFAGVDVTPTSPGIEPIFTLCLGIDREKDVQDAVGHMVPLTLSEELLSGVELKIEIRRGASRG